MIQKRNSLFVFLLAFFTACSSDKLNIDTSKIKLDIDYINLDSILVQSSDSELLNYHYNLQNKIDEIYDYQIGYCLQIGEVQDSVFIRSINLFKSDSGIVQLEEDIRSKFQDLTVYKEQITSGFKHLNYYFTDGKLPRNIVFMNSLFQSNAFSTHNEIGVGLERYLGYTNRIVQKLPPETFYDWMKKGWEEEYLVRDVLCSWIMTHFIEEQDNSLVESMIQWGKILYLTEAALPDSDKRIILRYTAQQYEWADKNELLFWKYLVKEKMLFKNSGLEKANFLNEGPYTVGLPENSPDRMGQFIGWKMVRNFMNKKGFKIEDLPKIPYNQILQEYKIND